MKAPADAILWRMARLASREASLSSRGDARTTSATRGRASAGSQRAHAPRHQVARRWPPPVGAGSAAAALDDDLLADLPVGVAKALHEDRGQLDLVGEHADARDGRAGRRRGRDEAGGEARDERTTVDQASSRSSRSRKASSRRLISSRVARYRASSWPTGSRTSPPSPANSPS